MMHTEIATTCCGKTTVWMFGDEIQRVTGRKDEFHEVDEFICNRCRFDHKDVKTGLLKDQENLKKIRLSIKTIILEN